MDTKAIVGNNGSTADGEMDDNELERRWNQSPIEQKFARILNQGMSDQSRDMLMFVGLWVKRRSVPLDAVEEILFQTRNTTGYIEMVLSYIYGRCQRRERMTFDEARFISMLDNEAWKAFITRTKAELAAQK